MLEEEAGESQGQLARALPCLAFPHQAFLCSLLSVDPLELVTLTELAGVVGFPWLYEASYRGLCSFPRGFSPGSPWLLDGRAMLWPESFRH